MTPDTVLHQKLSEAARRLRALLVYHWATRLLFWTTLVCLLWLLASRIGTRQAESLLPEPSAEALAVVLALAALVGIVIGFARRMTPVEVARLTDQRTAMKERLASALEFETQAADAPLVRRQIEDASAHARALNLRRVYPLRLTRETVGFLILALILFGAFFLPTLPIFWSAERRAEAEQVKRHGAAIEKIARDTEKTAAEKKLDETKKAAKEARKLAETMKRGGMTRKHAMIQMRKLTKQMQEQQKRLAAANTPGTKSLSKAAEEIKKALEQQQKAAEAAARAKMAQANKQGEAKNAANKAGQEAKPPEAMQKVQQAMQKFADALDSQNFEAQNQALQEIADQMQSGQMSAQEMQQLQQQMQQLSQALKNTDLNKAAQQLAELAKQMQQSNLDPEMLKKLARRLRQAGGTCLSRGQGSLDAKTLAALLEALKNGRLQLAMGNQPGQGSQKSAQQGIGPGGGGGGKGAGLSPAPFRPEDKNLKVARRAPNAKVKGTRSGQKDLSPTFVTRNDPTQGARATTPYYQVYQQQKRAAESPVNKENIPAPVRRLVKDYFEQIQP